MDNESKLQAIADYLSNTMDISSDEEIKGFLQEEFKLKQDKATLLTKNFISRFSTTPIIMENEAIELIKNVLKD